MAKVRPIPEGHHALTPHLVINGAAQAIEFYKKAFGATEIGRHLMPGSTEIMHAALKIGDSFLFLGDECGMGKSPKVLGGSPVTIHLYVEDVDKVYNKAVAAGAQAAMPLMDMFWGDRYGKLVDPFGHEWSIATHKEDVPPEELDQRAAAAMANM